MTTRAAIRVLLLTGIAAVSACGAGTVRTQAPAPVQTAVPAQRAASPAPAQAAAPARVAQAVAPTQAAALEQVPASAGSPASATGEYRLGAGDTIRITVYNNPDLTTEAEIAENGKISFPLVGEVTLGGLTRGEAERAVAAQLGSGGFVPDAHVNMLVLQYRSRQVAVMGEVNKPGNYPISKMTSITEALAMAGGISAKGSDRVTVIKRDGNGNSQRYEIDVRKLLASGDLSSNAFVDKDDIIFVPVAPVFYIYGEVRQPGAYPLAPDMTVRQALSLGGGLTVRGTERGIRLERKGKAKDTLTRRPHLDDRLQPNDVVYVPESWF